MLTTIIIVVFIFILLTVSIVFVILISKFSGSKIPPNADFLVSFEGTNTSGFSICIITNEEPDKYSDRTYLTVLPLDVPYDEKGKVVKEKAKPIQVTARKEKLLRCASGSVSGHRGIVFLAPDSAIELDQRFRNTPFGSMVAQWAEGAEMTDKAVMTIEQGLKTERSTLANLEKEENRLVRFWRDHAEAISSQNQSMFNNTPPKNITPQK